MRSTAGDARSGIVRNLFQNPQGTSFGKGWGWYSGTGGVAAKTTYLEGSEYVIRLTWSTANTGIPGGCYIIGTSGAVPHANRILVNDKKPVYWSAMVRATADTVVTPKVEFYDGTPTRLNTVSGPAVTAKANVWTQLWGKTTGRPPAGSLSVAPTFYADRLFAPGEYIEYKRAMFVQEDGYFEWTLGDAPGWKYLGTANDSESVGYPKAYYPWPNKLNTLQSTSGVGGETLTGFGGFTWNTGAGALTQDSTWYESAPQSIKLTPTANDFYYAPGGDQGAVRLGLEAGKTYTIRGTARWPTTPADTFAARTGTIRLFTKVGAAGYVESGPGLNSAVGATRLSHTATMPAGLTEAFIRFYCGSSSTPIYWDRLGVFEHNDYGAPPADYWVPGTS